MTAVSVRERGNEKYSKVVIFVYRVPTPLATAIGTCFAVTGCGLTTEALLVKRDECGRICSPSSDLGSPEDVVESVVLEKSVVMTVGQRCADWFIMRKLKVTGTNASKFIMSDNEVRITIYSEITDNCLQLPEPPDCGSCDSRILFSLLIYWFSNSRSREPMMRGSVNKGARL
jgi:hypothetical protein